MVKFVDLPPFFGHVGRRGRPACGQIPPPRGYLEGSVVASSPSTLPTSATPRRRRVCYLSRSRGWIDPDHPHRSTAEVNLLAVATGAPVWSLGTAWKALFRELMPRSIEDAFRKAMVRSRLTDEEVARLRNVAEHLRIDLVVRD